MTTSPPIFGDGRHPTGTAHLGRNVYDFFVKVPLEIRNQIYDSILQIGLVFPTQTGVTLRLQNAYRNNIPLISRQFRKEFLARTGYSNHCLVVEEQQRYDGTLLQVPTRLQYVTCVDLHLAISCRAEIYEYQWCNFLRCNPSYDLFKHRNAVLLPVARLRALQCLSIALYVRPHRYYGECTASLSQGSLVHDMMLPTLRYLTDKGIVPGFQVYRCDFEDVIWNFAGPKTLLMEYAATTREFRWTEDDSQIAQ